MTPEQSKVVEQVYEKFMEGEANFTWDEVDDQMVYLDYLGDGQLWREASVQHYEHTVSGTVKCSQEFCNNGCYAQTIVDAAGYILSNSKTVTLDNKITMNNDMTPKNRYVLEQYLALSQLGYIVRVTS